MYSESMSDQNALPFSYLGAGTNQNVNPGEEENEQYYKSPINFKGMNAGAGGFNDFTRYCLTETKVPFKNATNDTNLPQHANNYQGNQQHNIMPQCPFTTDKKGNNYQ